MALDQSALVELLGELKLTDVGDPIRVATETPYQELIDAEASAFIGADPFERTSARTTHRNGSRARTLTTTAGDLELRFPKLRAAPLGRRSTSTSCFAGLPAILPLARCLTGRRRRVAICCKRCSARTWSRRGAGWRGLGPMRRGNRAGPRRHYSHQREEPPNAASMHAYRLQRRRRSHFPHWR